jgi:hypothetical protein
MEREWDNAYYVLSCLGQFALPASPRFYNSLRRRSVIPTLASLGVFLVAFVISVALAFAEIGEYRTGTPLILGLLYCWLPLLVIFTIIDRNPVSSERSA